MEGMALLSTTMANEQNRAQVKSPAKTQLKPELKTPVNPPVKTQGKTKGSKVNRAWINDHVNDPYVKLAKHEGYRARAAYKLKEIDETFHLIKPGQLVVDLGSAPGAWSQYLRRKMVAKPSGQSATGGVPANQLSGCIIALDLLPMDPVDGVTFILGDIREQAVLDALEREMAGRLADMVVSDMAPNLSGIHGTDAARVEHLIELAIDFCQAHMKPQGALVAKVFHGTGYNDLVKLFKANFQVVKPVKPKASRDKSTETFLVGLGLKRA
jgi:23S rRNA (uridine2552-2'-O)-methyltransferase